MGIRPSELHPSRMVTKSNNFLFYHFLDATALPIGDIPNEDWNEQWDGATHIHGPIEGENWVMYALTHYFEDTDTYSVLYLSRSDYFDADTDHYTSGDGSTVIIDRGKTGEQLLEQEMRMDLDKLAPVVQLIKSLD